MSELLQEKNINSNSFNHKEFLQEHSSRFLNFDNKIKFYNLLSSSEKFAMSHPNLALDVISKSGNNSENFELGLHQLELLMSRPKYTPATQNATSFFSNLITYAMSTSNNDFTNIDLSKVEPLADFLLATKSFCYIPNYSTYNSLSHFNQKFMPEPFKNLHHTIEVYRQKLIPVNEYHERLITQLKDIAKTFELNDVQKAFLYSNNLCFFCTDDLHLFEYIPDLINDGTINKKLFDSLLSHSMYRYNVDQFHPYSESEPENPVSFDNVTEIIISNKLVNCLDFIISFGDSFELPDGLEAEGKKLLTEKNRTEADIENANLFKVRNFFEGINIEILDNFDIAGEVLDKTLKNIGNNSDIPDAFVVNRYLVSPMTAHLSESPALYATLHSQYPEINEYIKKELNPNNPYHDIALFRQAATTNPNWYYEYSQVYLGNGGDLELLDIIHQRIADCIQY